MADRKLIVVRFFSSISYVRISGYKYSQGTVLTEVLETVAKNTSAQKDSVYKRHRSDTGIIKKWIN
jgi:hypothetical protein